MKKNSTTGFSIVKKGYEPKEVDAYIASQKASGDVSLNEQKQRIQELKAALASAEATIKDYKEKGSIISKAIITAVDKANEIERLALQKYRLEMERLKVFHDKWISYYNRILQQYPIDENLTAISGFNRQINSILGDDDSSASSAPSISKAASDLEKTFEAESARLNTKGAGGAKTNKVVVKATADKPVETQSPASVKAVKNKQTEAQKSLILENGFDPIARISRYLEDAASVDLDESEARHEFKSLSKPSGKAHKNTVSALTEEETASASAADDYNDRSELGFSFQEALNPKDDLEQIMKDLGLFTDND